MTSRIDRCKTEAAIALLGADTDAAVAREVGCSRALITRLRKERGVAPFAPNKVVDWSGVDWSRSNVAIGAELGVSDAAVREHRERHGIAPSTHPGGRCDPPDVRRAKKRERVKAWRRANPERWAEHQRNQRRRSMERAKRIATQTTTRLANWGFWTGDE